MVIAVVPSWNFVNYSTILENCQVGKLIESVQMQPKNLAVGVTAQKGLFLGRGEGLFYGEVFLDHVVPCLLVAVQKFVSALPLTESPLAELLYAV